MGWYIRYYLCRKLTGNHLVVPVESRKYYNQTVLFSSYIEAYFCNARGVE